MTYNQTITLIIVLACSLTTTHRVEAANLSRTQAGRLIESHEDFSPTTLWVKFKPNLLRLGQKKGIWLVSAGWSNNIIQTELGKQMSFFEFFKTHTCRLNASQPSVPCISFQNASGFGRYDTARVQARVTLKVKAVTGITSLEPTSKQAEFTCTYTVAEGLWHVAEKRPETCTGVAVLKLYDDGWRVIAVKTTLPHHRGR